MTTLNRVRVLETTQGQIPTASLSQTYKLCLSHEILSPPTSNLPSDRPLTLETYHHHRTNLLSLQNASLVPGLIEHELQRLVQSSKITHKEILILDGSNYNAKLSQLFEKYTVLKGYNYQLEGDQNQNIKMGLLNRQHVTKQIEYEFKFGNGKFKPAFIGEIKLEDCQESSVYYSTFLAYLKHSKETDCPIFINTLRTAENPLIQKTINLKFQNWEQEYQSVSEKYKLLQKILKIAHQQNTTKIVLYNLPLIMTTTINKESFTQTTANATHHYLVHLLDHFQFTLGFDLSRYSSVESWNYVALLAQKYPNRIILSAGLRYKTDLSAFGGQGYLIYSQDCSQLSSLGHIANLLANPALLDQVTRLNKINLIDWQIRVDEVKLVLTWTCSNCANTQPQTVQSFRKFGKQFCSIKCLKSYKF